MRARAASWSEHLSHERFFSHSPGRDHFHRSRRRGRGEDANPRVCGRSQRSGPQRGRSGFVPHWATTPTTSPATSPATSSANCSPTTPTTATTTYHYDAQGNRVKKSGPSGTSIYVYDAFGKLAAEYKDSGTPTPGTFYRTVDHTACCSPHVARRSAPENRQDEARAAWRAEAYLTVR